ncbi:MAG TPA: hypothetical protein VED66_14690 [Candidatus Sulfotelmatobacter sp.]|nr:hypothetical protein [Candidatus Sulfotelmatobacter sp.]
MRSRVSHSVRCAFDQGFTFAATPGTMLIQGAMVGGRRDAEAVLGDLSQ